MVVNRKQVLTRIEKEIYDILVDEGGVTAEEIARTRHVKRNQIQKMFVNLRKKGVIIRQQKTGSGPGDDAIYWIDEEDVFEGKPTYKKEYKTRAEYGYDLLQGVKMVAEVQTNRFMPEVRHFDFESQLSIAILYLADFHIGHQHGDYGAMEFMFDLIANTEGLYVVFVGDMIDNSVNAIAPTGSTNIVDKDGQLAIYESLLAKVTDKKKLLIMFEGNHEVRSIISDHFRVTQYIAKQQDTEYGNFGHQFVVTMNGSPTIIYCRHKMKGHSQYNPLHQMVRAVLFDNCRHAGNADVLVRAHTHESAMGVFKVGNKVREMLVCGNAVVYDDFADRVGYESMKWSMPMTIIRPDGTRRNYRRFTEGIQDLKDFREIEMRRIEPEDDEEDGE